MVQKTKLSIIIPVFNKWNFTKTCLMDLSYLSSDHQIIVIDNASTDETSDQIQVFPHVAYIRNENNVFHSMACNQGFEMSQGEYICFLNNDVRVRNNRQNWTQKLIEACDKTHGLVGPTMGQLDKDLNFVKEANAQLTNNSYIGGWCICGKKETWESLKIADTNQVWNEEFPFYFNDTDLSFRARQKKIPLTFVDIPDIVHFGKVSAEQINIHKLYTEGRKVFIKKWGK